MAYRISEYNGDNTYSINATDDCVVGDEVAFEQAMFSGAWGKTEFVGFNFVKGTIIRKINSHRNKQHSFTIKLRDGSQLLIKSENLYINGVYRKPWNNECERHIKDGKKQTAALEEISGSFRVL